MSGERTDTPEVGTTLVLAHPDDEGVARLLAIQRGIDYHLFSLYTRGVVHTTVVGRGGRDEVIADLRHCLGAAA